MASVTKDLIDAINAMFKRKTSEYDATAVVKRIEGNRAWVHINGGVDETPVDTMTINARVGDTVRVHVGGGKAWIIGNATAPPTDDRKADVALKRTENVSDEVLELNEHITSSDRKIETVTKIAGDTNQYFWHTQTGTDTGAHITEKPQDEFLEDPSNGGGNLLARSNGIAVRDGLDELATFGTSGAQIGASSGIHSTINSYGFNLYNGSSHKFGALDVSTQFSGKVTETFTADGSNSSFTLKFPTDTINGQLVVKVNGTTVSWLSSVAKSGATVVNLSSTPASGASVTVSYYIVSGSLYGLFVGKKSGYLNSASASLGYNTEASGRNSIATNTGTVAASESQTAVGSFNARDEDGQYYFIVGNGTEDSNRSNALTVDTNGALAIGDPATSFVTTEHQIINEQMTGGNYKNGTTSITKAGYFPIAVSGWYSYARYTTVTRAYLSAQANGSGTISWGVSNWDSSAHTADCKVYVLWIKVA